MIVYKNVCDHCGIEEEIKESSPSFAFNFTTLSTYDQEINNKRHSMRPFEVTFCSKECLCSWFNENIRNNGTIIGHDDED